MSDILSFALGGLKAAETAVETVVEKAAGESPAAVASAVSGVAVDLGGVFLSAVEHEARTFRVVGSLKGKSAHSPEVDLEFLTDDTGRQRIKASIAGRELPVEALNGLLERLGL